MSTSYDYVAYIDESGDDGLRAVKPLTIPGSSEWLILSAVLVRAANQSKTKDWVAAIRGSLNSHQVRSVHFAKLDPSKKRLACEALASLEARYFVVASNKKNMQGYKNPDAERIPSQCWFYCWMSRVLLERVTRYVLQHSTREYGEPRHVRLEFSERGGLRYSQMQAYYEWLKLKRSNPFLPWGKIEWETLHPDLFFVYPHWQREGLQLADIVASAFFKACDKHDTGACDPQFAKLLKPRMAREPDTPAGQISGYGVKLLPKLAEAKLDGGQAEIFRFYGYPRQWWDPAAFS
ncbi:MAG TPA: DUF3800 domain-containing protein [Devosiaceae bacterium]